MHYYKRNIGDYHKKAGRLTMLQHGAYTLLMDSCYDREQFPTLEEAIEWVWASTPEEIEAVKFVLERFFTLEDGVYIQKRTQGEIAQYHKNAATNKRIAIERETNRKKKSTKRARTVNEPPPNHKPRTINQEPETKVDFSILNITEGQLGELKRIRKKNKGGSLSERVVKALAKEFEQAKSKGWTIEDILTEWEYREWKSFKSDWVDQKTVKGNNGASTMGMFPQ